MCWWYQVSFYWKGIHKIPLHWVSPSEVFRPLSTVDSVWMSLRCVPVLSRKHCFCLWCYVYFIIWIMWTRSNFPVGFIFPVTLGATVKNFYTRLPFRKVTGIAVRNKIDLSGKAISDGYVSTWLSFVILGPWPCAYAKTIMCQWHFC